MHLKTLFRGTLVAAALALSSASAFALKVNIVVSKPGQKMTVTVDGVQKYVWLVSTGSGQYDTPSGTYHIFRMEKEYFSKEWDNAPMPYSMFFTGQGHAIHGTYHIKRLGTKASHGCVRLAPENAAILFDLVTKAGYKNNTVVIKGGFFDSGTSTVSIDQPPRKPFRWFWDKPKVPSLKVVYATPSKKKKKIKKPLIIGGL